MSDWLADTFGSGPIRAEFAPQRGNMRRRPRPGELEWMDDYPTDYPGESANFERLMPPPSGSMNWMVGPDGQLVQGNSPVGRYHGNPTPGGFAPRNKREGMAYLDHPEKREGFTGWATYDDFLNGMMRQSHAPSLMNPGDPRIANKYRKPGPPAPGPRNARLGGMLAR